MTFTAVSQRSNAEVRTSFKHTVTGAFKALGRDIILLSKQHLNRRKILPVISKDVTATHKSCRAIGMADYCDDGDATLAPVARTVTAPTELTDLPACILNHIISLLDSGCRLPLFRTCKLLRGAILGYVALDGGQQLTTFLRLVSDIMPPSVVQQHVTHDALSCEQASEPFSHGHVPGLSARAASRLLKLGAQSAHEVHLHAQSHLPTRFTSQQMSRAITGKSKDGNTCGSGSRKIMASYKAADWLLAVFKPGLSPTQKAPLLQCVTKIWLQDMALDHAMPRYIGHMCPALKIYGLHNVVWPVYAEEITDSCWPNVQELTLSDVCHQHLAETINPDSLPKLNSMRVAWSHKYALAQFFLHMNSTEALSLCVRGFCGQLTELNLDGLAWLMILPCDKVQDLGTVTAKDINCLFLRLKNLSIVHPPPGCRVTYGSMLRLLVECTPTLQRLHLDTLHLDRDYTGTHVQWPHLQYLQIDAFETEMFTTLAYMPCMPKLRHVAVAKGSSTLHVQVEGDWVVDVVKAMTAPDLETILAVPVAGRALRSLNVHTAIQLQITKARKACQQFCSDFSAAVRLMRLQKPRG